MGGVFKLVLLTFHYALASVVLGDYELWNYLGSYVHDYSGNSNHGVIYSPDNFPILTDRGVYIKNSFSIQFPFYPNVEFPTTHTDMVFSILFYPELDTSCLISFKIGDQTLEICFSNIIGMLVVQVQGDISLSLKVGTDLYTWKLYIIRLTQRVPGLYVSIYLDGDDTNSVLDMLLTDIAFNISTTSWSFGTNSKSIEGFLYQIWWHGSISTTIKNLSKQFIEKGDINCGSLYSLNPFKKCLSNVLDPYKNEEGRDCSLACTRMKKSCGITGDCIQDCNFKCVSTSLCRTSLSSMCPNACPSRCKRCIKGTDYCLECNQGYILNLPHDGTCIFEIQHCTALDSLFRCAACESGYYLNNNTPPSCTSCPVGCARCFYNSGQPVCGQCTAESFTQPSGPTHICNTVCPSNVAGSLVRFPSSCQYCPSNCTACYYDSSTNRFYCTACSSGYKLYNRSCIAICPSYYFSNGNNCIKCSISCMRCSSINGCDQCSQDLELYSYKFYNYTLPAPHYVFDQKCYDCSDGCPSDYTFLESTYNLCLNNCKLCNDGGTCIQCLDGYFLVDNKGVYQNVRPVYIYQEMEAAL